MLQPPDYPAFAQVVGDEMASSQLRMIETAGHYKGLAPFVDQFKAAGTPVVHKCVALRHAKSAARLGVDAISLDGFESARATLEKMTSATGYSALSQLKSWTSPS